MKFVFNIPLHTAEMQIQGELKLLLVNCVIMYGDMEETLEILLAGATSLLKWLHFGLPFKVVRTEMSSYSVE